MNVALTVLGIALPSLLLTAAIRRWIVHVPWRVALLFLAMTFIFQHDAVFTNKLPVPVDEVARGYPYRGVVGEVTPRNPLTNDTVKLFLPWMHVVREELAHFRVPLWNRYSFSGYPLLANGESAPFSPLFLATLFVPLPKQIVAMAGLKIFIALLFGFLIARREGLSQPSSCFVATVFSWSVFQTVFLYYSTTAVTALLPAALFALLHAHDRGGRPAGVFVALVVATLMANGHPESVLHIAIVCGGVLLIDLVLSSERKEWMLRMWVPVLGTITGLALSAPTWIPVLEQVFLSSRLADIRRAAEHAAPYPLTAIWAMVSPNGFGNPVRGNWNWISNYSLVAASYVTLLVLALVAAAAVSRRTTTRERLWIAFAVLLWLIALGWTPVGEAMNSVPPFSITANDKLRFGALFLGAVVAGRTADRLRREPLHSFSVFAVILAALAAYVYLERPGILRPVDMAAPAAVLGVLLAAKRFPRSVPAAAFVLASTELLLLNGGFNALVDERYYRPRLPIIEELVRIAPHEPYRIAGFDWAFLPNASAQYGVEDIRGSDPMSLDSYTEFIKPIVVDDRSMDFDRVVEVNHKLLDFLNVRYLITDPAVEAGGRWRAVYRGPDGTLFENSSALPRFFAREGDADVAIRQLTPTRLALWVTARTEALIGSSQVAAPGWRVRVDGKQVPIDALEPGFIAFRVPPGRAKVEVAYVPLAFWGSVPLSLAALLLMSFAKPWNRGWWAGVVRGPRAGPVL